MPARPSPGKVFQLTYHWAIGSDLAAIVRQFFTYTGALVTADATTIGTQVNTAQAANLRSLTVTSTTYLGCVVTDLLSTSGPEVFVPATSAGTRAGSALPGDACAVQQIHIARRYRGGHPRTYWPFGTSNDTASAQTWSAAFVTACQTQMTAHNTAWFAGVPVGVGSIFLSNISYYSGFTNITLPSGRATSRPNLRVTPIVDQPVTFSFRTTIGSQRRRLKPAS